MFFRSVSETSGNELGPSGREDAKRDVRAVRSGRVETPDLPYELDFCRIAMGDGHLGQRALRVDRLDDAPVGDAARDQVGDPRERLAIVEVDHEQPTRLGQEALGLFPAFPLADVVHDDRGADDLARRAPDRCDVERDVDVGAVLAAPDGLELLGRLTPSQACEQTFDLGGALGRGEDGDRFPRPPRRDSRTVARRWRSSRG